MLTSVDNPVDDVGVEPDDGENRPTAVRKQCEEILEFYVSSVRSGITMIALKYQNDIKWTCDKWYSSSYVNVELLQCYQFSVLWLKPTLNNSVIINILILTSLLLLLAIFTHHICTFLHFSVFAFYP